MIKDKEWLKVEIGNYYPSQEEIDNPDFDVISKSVVLKIADQLDESEKVVIPQFFAEWIEGRINGITKGGLVAQLWVDYFRNDFTGNERIWLTGKKELATRAILDGYTIEQPKLLTVIVKDYDKTIMTKQLPEDEINKMMEGLE